MASPKGFIGSLKGLDKLLDGLWFDRRSQGLPPRAHGLPPGGGGVRLRVGLGGTIARPGTGGGLSKSSSPFFLPVISGRNWVTGLRLSLGALDALLNDRRLDGFMLAAILGAFMLLMLGAAPPRMLSRGEGSLAKDFSSSISLYFFCCFWRR
jgi:hypothetical protein